VRSDRTFLGIGAFDKRYDSFFKQVQVRGVKPKLSSTLSTDSSLDMIDLITDYSALPRGD